MRKRPCTPSSGVSTDERGCALLAEQRGGFRCLGCLVGMIPRQTRHLPVDLFDFQPRERDRGMTTVETRFSLVSPSQRLEPNLPKHGMNRFFAPSWLGILYLKGSPPLQSHGNEMSLADQSITLAEGSNQGSFSLSVRPFLHRNTSS